MGVVENIRHDRFPSQSEDLGQRVDLIIGDNPVKGTVVRSDAELPDRVIYRTDEGTYLGDRDIEEGNLPPPQDSWLGKRVNVNFHYDTSITVPGTIVRDDNSNERTPYHILIELDDGRVVSSLECQYGPSAENSPVREPEPNKRIDVLQAQLKKQNPHERARTLHGIYKQLVPSSRGRLTNGAYRHLAEDKPNVTFALGPEDIENFANILVREEQAQEFVGYVASEMRQFDHLQNHAAKLEDKYIGPVRVAAASVEPSISLN